MMSLDYYLGRRGLMMNLSQETCLLSKFKEPTGCWGGGYQCSRYSYL